MTENGELDYLQDDWDFCPVCDRRERECICPPDDDQPTKHTTTIVIDLVEVLKASLPIGARS